MSFCIADEQGKHARVVGYDTTLNGTTISFVTWSPDGHDLVYIANPHEIHTLSVDTGRVSIVRLGPGWRIGGGVSLTWSRVPI